MVKNVWVQPQTTVQQFVANEYVAACGDINKVYKFTCDAPSGFLYYYPTSDGKVDGEYNGNGWPLPLWWYTPCSASTHEASTTSVFYDGFIDYNTNVKQDPGEGVIVWRGPNNDNGHATKNLDMDSWPTDKS